MKIAILATMTVALLTPPLAGAQPMLPIPTGPALPDNALLYNLALRVITCDRKNAGTGEGRVSVQLDTTSAPYFLDRPRDDFNRGHVSEYSILLGELPLSDFDGVSAPRLGDVTRIRLQVQGKDGWCISALSLFANQQLVFTKSFGAGRWLDTNNNGRNPILEISRSELRASPHWPTAPGSTVCRPPRVITYQTLDRAMESHIGAFIRQPGLFQRLRSELDVSVPGVVTGIRWRKDGITLRRADTTSYYFTIRLKVGLKTRLLPDVNVTIAGYLDLGCDILNGASVSVRDVRVSSGLRASRAVKILSFGTIAAIERIVESVMLDRIARFATEELHALDLTLDVPLGAAAFACPGIGIDFASNLHLDWPVILGTDIGALPALCWP